MNRVVLSALTAIAIAGCAAPSLQLGKLPPVSDPANAGEVVVVRPSAFIGGETGPRAKAAG